MTRILIADDNPQNLYLLETVLKSHGHEVVSARNGIEAIELAVKNPPDLIVTDILMPGMDGFELCRRWRAHELLNQIPFIFYTATYTDLKDEQFALSLGADRFLIKPQQPEVLIQVVKEVLAKPRKTRQASRKKSPENETKVLQKYNEVLFRKLEKKVKQLEETVAKQKSTEDELRESERKYRLLVENINDVFYTLDNNGNITYVSPAVERLSQYKAADLTGKPFTSIIYPDDLPDLLDSYNRLVSGQVEPSEFRILDKDGSIKFVRTSSRPIYEGGEIAGITALITDITERKKLEKALSDELLRRRILVEQSRDGIVILDRNGKVYESNKQFAAMLGYSREEVGQLYVYDWEYQVPREKVLEMLDDVDTTGDHFITQHRRKDGTTFYVEISTNAATIEDQKLIFCVCRDITERKQAEEDLIKSYQKTKKTLRDAIDTMAKIVEMRDPYTAGHQQRVAELAIAIAKELGYQQDHLEYLRMAAIIHDIGKIYVPSDILSKPGKLNTVEFNLIKTHAQGGFEILKNMEFPTSVAQSVLQHHERLDGSGYPNGLKGEAILREARVLAVADVVEAISSHRPYRPALGIDKALEEISENKGILYDVDTVDACLRLFTEKGFKFAT